MIARGLEVALDHLVVGQVHVEHPPGAQDVHLDVVHRRVGVGDDPVVFDRGHHAGAEVQERLVQVRDVEAALLQDHGTGHRVDPLDLVLEQVAQGVHRVAAQEPQDRALLCPGQHPGRHADRVVQAEVGGHDLPEGALLDIPAGDHDRRIPAGVKVHHETHAGSAYRLGHRFGVLEGRGQGLFRDHVLARPGGRHDRLPVGEIRGHHCHRLELPVRHQLPEVRVHPPGSVSLPYPAGPLRVAVAHGDELGARVAGVDLGMDLSPQSGADDPEADLGAHLRSPLRTPPAPARRKSPPRTGAGSTACRARPAPVRDAPAGRAAALPL